MARYVFTHDVDHLVCQGGTELLLAYLIHEIRVVKQHITTLKRRYPHGFEIRYRYTLQGVHHRGVELSFSYEVREGVLKTYLRIRFYYFHVYSLC